jgi:hypothetical protein
MLLGGLMTSTEAAPRRFFGGYSGWFGYPAFVQPRIASPFYRVKKRKIRSGAAARRHKPEPVVGFGEIPKGPLQIVISIGTQRVTLFSNGVRVAQGPVSTGTASHPTPLGIFSILEKNRHHRSNLYSNAPMPYMQRLTWSGVALHEGVLPGYPASHGCIRLSRDFAAKLWPTTRLGARVIVARDEMAPADFHHPKLFGPKQKPREPAVAMNSTDGAGVSEPVKLAHAPAADAEGSATDAARAGEPTTATGTQKPIRPAAAAPLQPGELRKSVGVSGSREPPMVTEGASAAPGSPPAQAVPSASDPEKPPPTIDPLKPAAPRTRSADQPAKRGGHVAVFVSRKERKVFVRQGFVPAFDMPVAIDEPDQPLGTHLFTAMAPADGGAAMRWNLFTMPTSGSPPTDSNRRRRSKELPKPVVQTRAPSTAAEALDRIHMPKEAVDRISELLVPGSSLVISDEGLGRETGRYTEFIVLTR